MLDKVSPRDQCRLLKEGNSVGGAIMAIMPNTSVHTAMKSDLYRLGLKPLPLTSQSANVLQKCPGCLGKVDVLRDHVLCCQRNNSLKRQNAVQESSIFV